MNRIKEIRIIEAYGGRSPYVVFRDELDVRDGWYGQSYRPSYHALEIIRRLGRCMDVDMDFRAGVTTLRRREAQADMEYPQIDVRELCQALGVEYDHAKSTTFYLMLVKQYRLLHLSAQQQAQANGAKYFPECDLVASHRRHIG